MSVHIPYTTFSNGQNIPVIGLGTWKSAPGKVSQAVKDAIDAGYRHIDCAAAYQNEAEVGDAVSEKINEGTVKREDLFITGKLWNTYHSPDSVERGLKRTLKDLKLDYLDLYLIHWPMAYKDGDELFPRDEDNKIIYSDLPYTETWPAMEKLVKQGLVKSIGLSNFNSKQIDDILAIAEIPPVNLQVECHPYLNQRKLKEYAENNAIKITAYSPLGSPDRAWAKKDEPLLMEDDAVIQVAKKYNTTPAQILIKYQLNRGNIVLAKSVTKERIIANSQVFDFDFDPSDMDVLDSLDKRERFIHLEWCRDHKHYPFEGVDF